MWFRYMYVLLHLLTFMHEASGIRMDMLYCCTGSAVVLPVEIRRKELLTSVHTDRTSLLMLWDGCSEPVVLKGG